MYTVIAIALMHFVKSPANHLGSERSIPPDYGLFCQNRQKLKNVFKTSFSFYKSNSMPTSDK